MRIYPNTSIANPSTGTPVTREERREEADRFLVRDFEREQLLIRPISATLMRTKTGDHPAVHVGALVLTGPRKGHVFHNAPVFFVSVVEILTAVLDSPFTQVVAGKVSTHPDGYRGRTLVTTLIELTSESDIAYAAERASALGWDTSTPATEKELLGWNLAQARKDAKLSQSDAAEMVGWAQPQLSAVESGSRTVSAFELRDFARLYRTTMARLLP